MKTIQTDSEAYRNLRRYWTKLDDTHLSLQEWLTENGATVKRYNGITLMIDIHGIACGYDTLLIVNEKKFAWLLLHI